MEMVSQLTKYQHSGEDVIKGAILDNGSPVAAEGARLYYMITLVYVTDEFV